MIINITSREKNALNAIDARELDNLIEKAVNEESLGPISQLPLSECGEYVSTYLRYFKDALNESAKAKSPKNQQEKLRRAITAGERLSHAFYNMKDRMKKEECYEQLFKIDDHIHTPYTLSSKMELRISYQWRLSADEDWNYRSISFLHELKKRLNLHSMRSSRKLSATVQSRELQKELYDEWDHLKRVALYTLRDYFQKGGEGDKIPETFTVITDSYFGTLNNRSAIFWEEDVSSL